MANLETVKYLGGTHKEIAESINNNFTVLNTGKLEANSKAVAAVTADSAAKLTTARTINLTGAVTGSVSTDLSGNASIATTLTNFDASKMTSGIIDIARLPQGALERMIIVADDATRLALTIATAQKGDTIKVTATGKMYFVVDDTKLNTEAGYEVYTAGSATTVPWGGVTGKPTVISAFTNDVGYQKASDVKTAIDNAVGDINVINKITFTAADARWGVLANGLYPLTLATNNKEIILVMRDNAGTVEQCEVGVKVSGNSRVVSSYDKFAGYVICI